MEPIDPTIDWKARAEKAEAENKRLKELFEHEHSDGMVAHRWFAKKYGESMNGRDFSVKVQMADAEDERLRTEARQQAALAAKYRAALERIHKGACLTAQESRSRDDDRYCLAYVIQTSATALALPAPAALGAVRREAAAEALEGLVSGDLFSETPVIISIVRRRAAELREGKVDEI